MTQDTSKSPEMSRIVQLDELGGDELLIDLNPTAQELRALGLRLGVEALEHLEGQVSLKFVDDDDVLLHARFNARVKQTCSVTLKPLENDISCDFTSTYSKEPDPNWGHDEEEFADIDEDIEPAEEIVDGKIDVGEAVAEQLALEIDPFPRVKDATFEGFSTDPQGLEAQEEEKKNPFAVLAKLKTKQENSE